MHLMELLQAVADGRLKYSAANMGEAAFAEALQTAQAANDKCLLGAFSVHHEAQSGSRLIDYFSIQGLSARGQAMLRRGGPGSP
jgi:hypothetical protein